MAYYEPKTPFIICDTRDQIMQVLDAVRAHKVEEKLAEFAKMAGPNHEPACLYSAIGPVLFGASEHVGVIFDNEKAIDMWVSHVGNRRGEFYLLWGEVGRKFPSERTHEAADASRRPRDANICAFGNQASF